MNATFKNIKNYTLIFDHFYSVLIMENIARIMEKACKNHGISFREVAGNPDREALSLENLRYIFIKCI